MVTQYAMFKPNGNRLYLLKCIYIRYDARACCKQDGQKVLAAHGHAIRNVQTQWKSTVEECIYGTMHVHVANRMDSENTLHAPVGLVPN